MVVGAFTDPVFVVLPVEVDLAGKFGGFVDWPDAQLNKLIVKIDTETILVINKRGRDAECQGLRVRVLRALIQRYFCMRRRPSRSCRA